MKLESVPVHPGVSVTNIISNGPGSSGPKMIVLKLLAPILMQPDTAGALPTLYAATAPGVKGGEYIGPDGFMEMKGAPVVVQPKPQGQDMAVAKKLWEASEAATGVSYL
jgi:hypothetical protein